MNRQTPFQHLIPRGLIALGAMMLYTVLSLMAGPYTFRYIALWQSAVFHPQFSNAALTHPGGMAFFLSDAFVQCFFCPLAGVCLTALVLTLLTSLWAEVIHRLSRSWLLTPLAALPGIALLFLHYQPNSYYVATVSMLLAVLALQQRFRFHHPVSRYLYPALSTLALYIFAGPVALLYAVWLILIEWIEHPRQGVYTLLLPVMVFALASIYLWHGAAGDYRLLLTPEGYFTLRLKAGSLVYLPWCLSVVGIVLAVGMGKWNRTIPVRVGGCLLALQLLGVGLFAFRGIRQHVSPDGEFFKQLSCYSAEGDMQAILRACRQHPMDNMLFQNYYNMAMAEEGILADSLFYEPCMDIRTIYLTGDKTPFVEALMSDVYFSMGHIALAQRHAFEANEAMNNRSPRMLRRLVETNLITGDYGVADKYLAVLDRIPSQRGWVKRHRPFLYNEEAVSKDTLLGAKRRCLFPDNRFAGSKGLDDDLRQILLVNPTHRQTLYYLGSLYLLSKDLPRFLETLDTFYGTEALPEGPLPVAFQEAVLWAAQTQPELLERYPVGETVTARFSRFKEQPRSERHSFWYFFRYRR